MSDSLILTKAKAFAIRVVKLHKYLRGKREATMSKQILRCGTSIGANLAEAKYAQSRMTSFPSRRLLLRRRAKRFIGLSSFEMSISSPIMTPTRPFTLTVRS